MDDIVVDNLFQQQQNELENLSFRRTLLFYLKENAIPKLLLKFMQITKFFRYKEFPFFVVENLAVRETWHYKTFPLKNGTKKSNILDIKNVTKQLWVINSLNVYDHRRQFLASMILPKIAVCDISRLELVGQILSFNEWMFIILSNNITDLTMCSSIVKYDDGTIMPLEKYFEYLKNLTSFKFFIDYDMLSTVTKETAKTLTDLINPSCLTEFELYDIPENFDFNHFKEFMKLNPTIIYKLHFTRSQKLQYDLDVYIDSLIEKGIAKHCPPFVSYSGQDSPTYDALKKLHDDHLNRKKHSE